MVMMFVDGKRVDYTMVKTLVFIRRVYGWAIAPQQKQSPKGRVRPMINQFVRLKDAPPAGHCIVAHYPVDFGESL